MNKFLFYTFIFACSLTSVSCGGNDNDSDSTDPSTANTNDRIKGRVTVYRRGAVESLYSYTANWHAGGYGENRVSKNDEAAQIQLIEEGSLSFNAALSESEPDEYLWTDGNEYIYESPFHFKFSTNEQDYSPGSEIKVYNCVYSIYGDSFSLPRIQEITGTVYVKKITDSKITLEFKDLSFDARINGGSSYKVTINGEITFQFGDV